MPLPNPKRISSAVKIIFSLIMLSYGAVGVFYPAIIPAEITSLIPTKIFSVSRHDIILITAFASMVAGFILFMKRG